MVEFLNNPIVGFVLVILVLLIIYIGLQTRFKSQIAGFVLELAREAEEEWGDGTGLIKKSFVCALIYDKLPPIAKFLLPQSVIGKLIDIAARDLKEYLEKIKGEQVVRLIGKAI